MTAKNAKKSGITILESEKLLRIALAGSPGHFYWKNKSGVYLGCNDNQAHYLGFKHGDEVIGKTDFELPWKDKAAQFQQMDQQVIRDGVTLTAEESVRRVDGQESIVLSTKTPLRDDSGNIIGVLGYSVDISERKEMEASLRKARDAAEIASKAKSEFLENMRHDIRTPLSGIVGFADIIKSEANNPKIKEYADNLVASSKALLELLNEVLEAIQVASGEIPLLKKKFNFQDKLNSVITLNQSRAKQKSLSLIFNHDENIPQYVIGDHTRVHRIIMELVNNALTFTEKGSVTVKTELAKRSNRDIVIKVIVEDTGVGIAPKEQQAIFVQFKRLTPSYEGIYKGAGLGLSIIRQFIDDLDGEIYVESVPKQGTIFTCLFPFKEALLDDAFGSDVSIGSINSSFGENKVNQVISLTTTLTPANDNQVKSRILLVEDQAIAAKVAKIMLTDLSCDVDIAIDGESAIERARANRYDLIFMDVGLPDISGNEVTKRIRLFEWDKEQPVPIVALTAHVDPKNKQECIEAGMNAVLTKPLVTEKAKDILNAFIPKHNKNEKNSESLTIASEHTLLTITEPVFDQHTALQTVGGNQALLDEMLSILVDGFSEEMTKLEKYYSEANWDGIQAIAHKIRGATSYCGTLRLKEACARLEKYIMNGQRELASDLYKQLLTEIEAVKEYVLHTKKEN